MTSSGGLLPDVPEVERTRRAYAAGPLSDEARWQVGEDLRSLLAGYHPDDKGEREKEREQRLVMLAAAVGSGATTAKLREVWRLAVILDGNRVAGKTWDDHWRAVHNSAPGRGRHNLTVALELLDDNPETIAAMDPVSTVEGLNERQRDTARRILRNHKDFADPAVAAAVAGLLRGSAKKGVQRVASAEQEHLRVMRDRAMIEAEEAEAINPSTKVLHGYHDDVLAMTDRLYSIKAIVDAMPPGPWRQMLASMLSGSLAVAGKAIDMLLDSLEALPAEPVPVQESTLPDSMLPPRLDSPHASGWA